MPKPRKPDEGPFETLLREFMAGRMSSKQGNARIRSLMARRERKAHDHGIEQEASRHWNPPVKFHKNFLAAQFYEYRRNQGKASAIRGRK